MEERHKDDEAARIATVYARREVTVAPGRYSAFDAAAMLHRQSVERAVLALLQRRGLTDLSDARILDVGCGSGYWTRRVLDYGATPANLCGVDVLPERLARAGELHAGITWLHADATRLPLADASCDLVMAYTVLSSVLDPAVRAAIASEMRRVLAPERGVILIHDFAVDNPHNPDVRGLPPKELRRLFAGMCADVRRCVLAPPISRRVAPRSVWLAQTLEAMRLANTHYVAALW